MHEVVPVQEWHIKELAETMQIEDKQSVWALAHFSPEQGLKHSLTNSIESYTWLADNKVGAIYGITSGTLLDSYVCPWFLGSDLVKKYPRIFLTGCKEWVEDTVNKYDWLQNYVDARHKRSIKWLKWMGFKIHPEQPLGLDGLLFHKNELRKEWVERLKIS